MVMAEIERSSQAKRRGRGGRPKAGPEERRGEPLSVRLNAAERAQVKRQAASVGMTLAEFLRASALGQEVPQAVPEINRKAWMELARTAEDLHHLVGLTKAGQAVGISRELAEQMLAEVQALRRALLGVKERWGEAESEDGREVGRAARG